MSETHKIVCTRRNAGDTINGVAFREEAAGMVADDVPANVAERFERIPGYLVTPPINLPGQPAQETGGRKAIKDMRVGDIVALLEDHPAAYADVEAAEAQRDKPRAGVVEAVDAARDTLDRSGDNPDGA